MIGPVHPVRMIWGSRLRPSVAAGSGTSPVCDDEGFQVANELNRFAIGDRNDLELGANGSLDIAIQHERPEAGTSNWLPAPPGSFNLTARLYYPKPEVLDGTWAPPAVRNAG
jgi:hypothetical protein